MRLRLLAFALGAATFCVAAALPTAALNEKVLRASVPRGVTGPPDQIEVTLYVPRGAGPFPVVILSHGSPRSASDRRRSGRIRFEEQSRELVSMGYAVVVPTRRGYGDSGGNWSEGYGSCDAPDYFHAGLQTARDIVAAWSVVREQPGLDPQRVVLAGVSAGGWGSVAASSLPLEGLVGVVNFAGGRGSSAPYQVCNEERLVEAARRYGQSSRVPQLWIYSENDQFFGPTLARRMHEAFTAAGGRAEFVKAPAQRGDGHAYFGAVEDWSAPVEAFLRRAREEAALRAAKGN